MRAPSLAACAALVLLAVAPARGEESTPQLPLESYTLPNGLRVVLHEDHARPSVALVLWFHVGSKDETPGRTGFAHLFEHLMFKGSAHVPDGLMDRVLEQAGGYSTAFTDSDETVYTDEAAANFLDAMLWMEQDRLATLLDVFDQKKLDNQRDVVRNERRQSYDNRPYGKSWLLIPPALWPAKHGYHWSTIGSHEDLVAATVDDVKAFFRNYYVPGNATLVVAGDFDAKAARELIERRLGALPAKPAPTRPSYATPAPIGKEVRLAATDKVQVPRVYLEWRGPVAFAPDEPALDLAAAVLAGGKASRLYKRLVYAEKLAQDVSAGFQGQELGGTFDLEITAKPGVAPEKLIAIVDEELARLAHAAPEAAELELAVNAHEAGLLGELESLPSRALRLASYDVRLHDAAYLGKDLARYRAVTRDDVQRAAAKWLAPTARVRLVVSPEASK